MPIHPLATTIRAKRLGVLIRDARLTAGRSVTECAEILGVSSAAFEEYELGVNSPSLPDLEILSYILQIPIEHFWGQTTSSAARPSVNRSDLEKMVRLRQRIIGALLRQARTQAGLTVDQLATQVGVFEKSLVEYEFGEHPIPLPQLEAIANALGRPIKDFQDQRSPIGTWSAQQRALQHLAELPPDLQGFISRPVNRPYLELAQRLSEMSVEKLRSVGEGILEITL